MSIIKFLFSKFWNLHRTLISKNITFKKKHINEECIILGNGSSLKFVDTGLLEDFIKIGCSYSLTDKRLQKIGLEYCVYSDTYLLYKFLRHSYTGKIVLNRISPILKEIIIKNPDTIFFTSITNFYAFFKKPKNLKYFHNFGIKKHGSSDLAKNLSMAEGALDIMLGVARYMGFSKIYLFGCDYLGSPKLEGHFYDFKTPVIGEDDVGYQRRLGELACGMDITLVVPNGTTSKVFKTITFDKFFSNKKGCEKYFPNTAIVSDEYLGRMETAGKHGQIWM